MEGYLDDSPKPGWAFSPENILKTMLSFPPGRGPGKACGGEPRINTQASAPPQPCPEVLTEPLNKSEDFSST